MPQVTTLDRVDRLRVGFPVTPPASGVLSVEGATTIGGTLAVTGALTFSGALDMSNRPITNIGAAGTDFSATGALTLADILTVSAGGIAVTGNSTITGTLGGLTGLTVASGTFLVSSVGPHAIGTTTNTQIGLRIAGAFTGASAVYGVSIEGSYSPAVNGSAYGLQVAPTFNKAASGTHTEFAGTIFPIPTIVAGAATLTTASTVQIAGAPSAGGTNYALLIQAGGMAVTGNSTITGTLGGLTGLTVASGGATITAGNLGIGAAAAGNIGVYATGAILSGDVNQFGFASDATASSAATTEGIGIYAKIAAANASFTMTTATGVKVATLSKGVSATITTARGLYVAAQTVGSTNNYGIYVETPSGGSGTNSGITVAGGGIAVTGNSTITGTLGGLTGLTVASGNVGIAAAATAKSALEVGSGSANISINSDIASTISTNAYYSSGWKYLAAGFATQFDFNAGGSGPVVINNAVSGAKDAALTWVERVRIGAAGNVTIAAPDSGVGLTVSGGGIAVTGASRVTGGALDLGTATSSLGILKFNGNTSGTVTMQSAAAAGTWTMTLPTGVAGTNGFQLTDAGGDGVCSWAAAASLRAFKEVGARFDPQTALSRLLSVPVYGFHYKPGQGTGDSATEYVGVMAEDAPWAMHYQGNVLNPVNAFGHTVLAIQAHEQRIAALESRYAN